MSDTIKQPGAWLESELTEAEIAEFLELSRILPELDAEQDRSIVIDRIAPYMNTFMHLFYLLMRSRLGLKADDEHGVTDRNGRDFNFAAYTVEFIVDKYNMGTLAEMTPEQVSKFITDNLLGNSYLPMLNGTPANEIMQLSTKGVKADGFTKNATITYEDGHKITIERFDKLQGLLSTPAKKILDTSLLYLTSGNYYRARRDRISPTVEIPLKEYGEACGYNLTPQTMPTPEEQTAENRRVAERMKDLKKNIRRDLRDLSSVVWTGEETKGRNKGDYKEMRIISSHSISQGLIRINFDIDAANYFVNSYIMQYPTALLKHDNRKPNAYVLGRKIAFHNSNDQNRAAGTESTLSVKSLLAAAPEIPTIDDLQNRKQRNWKDKIKRPLEAALDENISVGLIKKWEYRDPKNGKVYTPEKAQAFTWAQYERLMVDFIMVDAPEQAERRAAKAAAAEAAAIEKEQPRKKRGRPKKADNA